MKKDVEIDIEESIRQLVQRKEADVKVNKKGEESYCLTEEGKAKTLELIKSSEDYQLLLFTLTFNIESQRQGAKGNTPERFVALKKSLAFMEQFNPNFFEVFHKAVASGKMKGVSLK